MLLCLATFMNQMFSGPNNYKLKNTILNYTIHFVVEAHTECKHGKEWSLVLTKDTFRFTGTR